jgi:peptide/nickel transport system permease protein
MKRWSAWSRLLTQALFVLLAVGSLSFLMLQTLPGDAAYRIAAGRYGYDMVDTAAAQAVRAELGLDRPGWQRWLAWLADVVQGRMGQSLVSGEPVWEEVSAQLGATLHLSLVGWGLAVVLGLVLGLWTALVPARPLRWAVDGANTLLRASPTFLTGVMLSTLLAEQLGWLPVAGHGEAEHVLLPALTLALALCPGLTQVVRDAARHVLDSDAFEFAQVKGLPLRVVLWRHALPQVLLASVAYAGIQLVLLIEGMVVVESLFAWPGIGHALVHAVVDRDVPMIQGTALTMALLFVLLHGLVDAVQRWLDPRLADAHAAGSATSPDTASAGVQT